MTERPDIIAVRKWLEEERTYAEQKWQPRDVDLFNGEEYADWVKAYLYRSQVLGWENPLGRQALMKCLRTLLAMCESNVRRYGPLPDGGVPSGEICTLYPGKEK